MIFAIGSPSTHSDTNTLGALATTRGTWISGSSAYAVANRRWASASSA
jgi:hypothetical protein